MNVHTLPAKEVLSKLLTSGAGLSPSEAAIRLQEYGLNEIAEVRKTSLAVRFLSQFTHFLAILLWLAAGLCFAAEYLRPGEGLKSLGIAIIGVILINAVFTFIQEYRAERAVAALKALLPFNVKVIREGVEREVPAREVVPGDLFVLALRNCTASKRGKSRSDWCRNAASPRSSPTLTGKSTSTAAAFGTWCNGTNTTRGGKQFDLLQETESPACSSSYGLCDQPSKG